ncbi:MAG: exodeoxyribonuclease VII large subunit [Legionellaceae bacterium]|nr:exodeoxyribonuclease VII large subunit [Legionellaceae bacterium]
MTNYSKTLTVSQLNRHVRRWLEEDIGLVSVQGEVSNLSKPASGHCYFSLKDTGAQLRCVFFKNRHTVSSKQILQHGQQLILRGTLSVYEARGDYQLIVESVEAAGEGDLYRKYEELKIKLNALGLFDPARKKTWPIYPNTIGLITSPTGAAIRDVLTTLERRFPLANIRLYPSDVQGKQAAPQLVQAIKCANHDAMCDVLLLVRGGGSLEDLWSFNDESLAYTIAESILPIISGVGHETDFTIADFVADHRAATPTAAAETVTPDQAQLREHCTRLNQRLRIAMTRFLEQQQQHLTYASKHLRAPKYLLQSHNQTLDYLTRQLHTLVPRRIEEKQQALQQLTLTLHALSPLATLNRGYAIAKQGKHVLRRSQDVLIGSKLNIQLAEGALTCEVLKNDE